MLKDVKNYMPSRRITAILIIPVLVVIILLVLNSIYGQSKNKDKSNFVKEINKVIDTDGDGLEDWEEDMAGTDKNKKDTDGDGFSDMLEIRTGSDPLDPLNKKKKEKEIQKKLDAGAYSYDYRLDPNLTNTDRLAYQFLEEGIKLKKDGMSINEDLKKQVANKLIRSNSISLDLNKYSLDNLKISSTLDKEIFSENLINILDILKEKKLKEESYLLNQYLETKNTKYIYEIKNNIKVYNLVIEKIKRLNVPAEVSKEFLDFLNAFNAEVELINSYALIEKDPVSAIQAISIYREIDENYKKALLKLSIKLRN